MAPESRHRRPRRAAGPDVLTPEELERILGRIAAWRLPRWWVEQVRARFGLPAAAGGAGGPAREAGGRASPEAAELRQPLPPLPAGAAGGGGAAELLATGGRWAALSEWAARHGVSGSEAQRRWHLARSARRLPRVGRARS